MSAQRRSALEKNTVFVRPGARYVPVTPTEILRGGNASRGTPARACIILWGSINDRQCGVAVGSPSLSGLGPQAVGCVHTLVGTCMPESARWRGESGACEVPLHRANAVGENEVLVLWQKVPASRPSLCGVAAPEQLTRTTAAASGDSGHDGGAGFPTPPPVGRARLRLCHSRGERGPAPASWRAVAAAAAAAMCGASSVGEREGIA